MAFFEHHGRSLAKTISYRLIIILSNGLIVYFSTGQIDVTFQVLGLSSIASTFLYFLHERLWNHIHWGKHPIR